jgi:hypothetical protein
MLIRTGEFFFSRYGEWIFLWRRAVKVARGK